MTRYHIEWYERSREEWRVAFEVSVIFSACFQLMARLIHPQQLVLIEEILGKRFDYQNNSIPREVMIQLRVV